MKYFFLFGALLLHFGIKAQTIDPADFPGTADVDMVPQAPGCGNTADDESGFKCFSAYLVNFMRNHFKYPAQNGEEDLKQVLYVSFVIGKDGTVEEVDLVKSMSDKYDSEDYSEKTREAARALDAEVIRVIRLLQFEKPAYSKREAVPMYFIMPLKL
ncbi:MAG: energy transducer TonB [Owenweeksia sp.]